jgi:hypothetical protein
VQIRGRGERDEPKVYTPERVRPPCLQLLPVKRCISLIFAEAVTALATGLLGLGRKCLGVAVGNVRRRGSDQADDLLDLFA